MQLIICLLIVFVSGSVLALHLSPRQMYSARGLLMNPTTTDAQRHSVQKLLYISHEKWAIKKATEFKQFHRFKCRDISTEDLVLGSKIGLLRSARIYNGRTPFVRFSEIYVKSELLRTLTKHLSVTNCVSKRDRQSAREVKSNRTASIHRTVHAVDAIIESTELTPITNTAEKEFYETAWKYVDTLDAFTKRTIWLKYDYRFKTMRSNKFIAELMCCSEETVRKSMVKFSDGMRREVLCSYTSV